MYSNYGSFHFINGSKTFKSFQGQQISIFSDSTNNYINTDNLKYQLNNTNLPHFFSGTCNESTKNSFTIESINGTSMIYKVYKG